MYNVVFYEKTKTVENVVTTTDLVWNEETEVYDKVITTTTKTKTYRIPSKFVFSTATSCDKFFANDDVLESFVGKMPSLNSAVSMFENSKITSVSGEDDEPALFPSVTIADNMFNNCINLTTIDINLSSLSNVNGLVNGCSSLTSFTGSLGALEHGANLFSECPNLTTFNTSLDSLINGKEMFKGTIITTFENELPFLIEGTSMFEGTPITTFNISTPKLKIGDKMFKDCSGLISNASSSYSSLESAIEMFANTAFLTKANIKAPSLKYANSMFENSGVTFFEGNLDELIEADSMFANTPLATFSADNLDNLKSGKSMFTNTSISSWNIDMPSLENANYMFANNGEKGIKTFSGSLSSLDSAKGMFANSGLLSFTSNLPSLTVGEDMFTGCSLDAESVMYIIESLNRGAYITIGINCEDNDDAKNAFAISTGLYDSWNNIIERCNAAGLTVIWEFNPEA
jgi:hypothetical protein